MLRTISIDEIYESLTLENPWWVGEVGADRVSRFPKRTYLDGFTGLVEQRAVNRSVILLGPRRVGKTVMILQVINTLLTTGVAGQNILYISLDRPLYNGLSLEGIVATHLARTPGDGRRYFFFDEIQYVRDWERELKSLTDLYPDFRFVASGSAAAALRAKSTESGAGRFTDFLLPPLTFDEFIIFQSERNESLPRLRTFADDGFVAAAELRSIDIAYLNILFERYLAFGGYPEAVLSEYVQQNLDRFVREDIVEKVLLRDLPSLYGVQDTRELNSLFTTLCYNTAQEVSLEGLSKTGAISKNTIKRYLEYLEAAFLIRTVTRIDQAAARFQRQTTFKVHLTNPSLRAALFRPLNQDDPDFGALAETAVMSQWFHNPLDTPLHYARWDRGEIDIVHLNELRPSWFVEVKWSDRHVSRPLELTAVESFIKRHRDSIEDCTVTTRTRFGQLRLAGRDVELVPTAVHCWQVGRNAASARIDHQREFEF